MSEIEKMYENAGLSNMWVERYNDGYYELERYYDSYKEMISKMMKANDWTLTEAQEVAKRECKKEHPPFTAEKQIEIIKWLGKLAGKLEISSNYNDTQYLLYFYLNRKTRDEILPNISTGRSENFEESLAGLINSLWQDLTSEEKQQVKGFLE